MSWFHYLQDAGQLGAARELARFICQSLAPEGDNIDKVIAIYNEIKDANAKQKIDALLQIISTNGREILEDMQYIQAESDAMKLELLIAMPDQEARFADLRTKIINEIAELDELWQKTWTTEPTGGENVESLADSTCTPTGDENIEPIANSASEATGEENLSSAPIWTSEMANAEDPLAAPIWTSEPGEGEAPLPTPTAGTREQGDPGTLMPTQRRKVLHFKRSDSPLKKGASAAITRAISPVKTNETGVRTPVAGAEKPVGSVVKEAPSKDAAPYPEIAKPATPKETKVRPACPEIKGFRCTGEMAFACGDVINKVVEYQHEQTGMMFTLLPGGAFLMGSPDSEKGRIACEGPQHTVNIKPFLIGQHEVTQAVWFRIMASKPWRLMKWFIKEHVREGGLYPAIHVSWHDAKEFCRKLEFSLPSEAQWEYACRAGANTKYYWGNDMDNDYCWHWDNAGDKEDAYAHEVGQRVPNSFNLYDMLGNVWEWCDDTLHENYQNAPNDGSAWIDFKSTLRVIRGGAWNSWSDRSRCATRNHSDPKVKLDTIGFRVVKTLD